MKKKIGRIKIEVGYYVDLNNKDMVEHAKDVIVEDLCDLVKYADFEGVFKIEQTPKKTSANIAGFLKESCEWGL